MKIRAITLGQPLTRGNLGALKTNLLRVATLKEVFSDIGIEVEYIRFASPAFDHQTTMTEDNIFTNRDEIAATLDQYVQEGILGIYSFLPGLCDQESPLTPTQIQLLTDLPRMLKAHPNMFTSVQVASMKHGINFEAIHAGTKIIQDLATPDPFVNVQFAITTNVPPNTPFFPSAYHSGPQPTISVALEAADELNTVLDHFPSHSFPFSTIQKEIKTRFEAIYDQISGILIPFCQKEGFLFGGLDFSPAPYPTQEKSIGTALEKVGLCHFGEPGSVFAVGFLTQALQSVNRPKIGFSGFMQPLLEDYTIARRNNEGLVDLSKLLLFSTQCGLGLDCVPIPGDTDPKSLELLLWDLAMMSVRLNKPLTARLMPIPSKTAGEQTSFDFEYFTDSKICELPDVHSPDLTKIRTTNPSFLF
ncbi:MAG: DUF711 family protein [Promethearchaeota archaeon]